MISFLTNLPGKSWHFFCFPRESKVSDVTITASCQSSRPGPGWGRQMTTFGGPVGSEGSAWWALLLCCSWSVERRWGSSSSSSEPVLLLSSRFNGQVGGREEMFLSQHITSNHSLSFFFISKEILAIARARGQRFPFCCSHCHTSALLGFSSSRALKFLTGWGFFPYLQLSTWDSIFFFILPFRSPANKTPDSGTCGHPSIS